MSTGRRSRRSSSPIASASITCGKSSITSSRNIRIARRPEVFYGAVTQRTKNIRIAHGVRLLPFKFNNPIKVAEQAAVLDIMSNGRVDLGTGRSTTAQELDGFSVDYDRTRAEVREALDVIVKAWTDDILEYNGKLIQVPPRRVVPKPIQKPHPPMWMACVAPDSYQMAGDRGLGVLSFSLNFDFVHQAVAEYRKSFAHRTDQVGKFPNEAFGGLVICHVAENKEDEAIGIDGARWFMHNVGQVVQAADGEEPALLLRVPAHPDGARPRSQRHSRRAVEAASHGRGGQS